MSENNPFENNDQAKERKIPAAWVDNPFKAPDAHVEDLRTSSGDATLADDPISLSAGRGTAWISEGWGLFREAMGLWIGISVVFLAMLMGLGLIPIIGQLANYFLGTVFAAGLMIGCRSVDQGEGLRFDHLFAGFQKNLGQLMLIGLLYLAGMIIILLVVFVVFGGALVGMFLGKMTSDFSITTFLLATLIAMGLSIPLMMSIWFAPALVALNDMTAIAAMKLSFRGCLRNILPFLVYGVVFLILAIVATIPIGLGWLLLMPTMICATYAAYREIFLA